VDSVKFHLRVVHVELSSTQLAPAVVKMDVKMKGHVSGPMGGVWTNQHLGQTQLYQITLAPAGKTAAILGKSAMVSRM